MSKKVSISLALGGGGARGIAHVHVLKAFDDMGLRPDVIAGSSIGAIVGSGYAAGLTGTDIEELFVETFANRSAVFAALWKLRPQTFKTFSGSNFKFGQLDIERVLETFLPTSFPRVFDELKIPMKVTGTDYYGNKLKVMERGDLRKAIAASAAIPVLFTPVVVDDTVLIDGGINNPLPFDLFDHQEYKVVAVDVVGLPSGEPGSIPSRLDSAFGTSQLMMQSITNYKRKVAPPDLFLRPPVNDFRVLDFFKVKKILAQTAPVYDQTRKGLEGLLNVS